MDLAFWHPFFALLGIRLRYWAIIIVVVIVILALAYFVTRRPSV